jgi:hypothetical protein
MKRAARFIGGRLKFGAGPSPARSVRDLGLLAGGAEGGERDREARHGLRQQQQDSRRRWG